MSDLIEELGGYEASKNILLRKRYDHVAYSVDSNSFYDHEAAEHGGIDVRDLDDELLEYRRKHNIFEVGDKVVYKGEAGLNGLFEIERLTKTGKPKTVKTERFGNFPCRYCEVQHATDEEIQAGHRL